jgi:hypothetical protein
VKRTSIRATRRASPVALHDADDGQSVVEGNLLDATIVSLVELLEPLEDQSFYALYFFRQPLILPRCIPSYLPNMFLSFVKG